MGGVMPRKTEMEERWRISDLQDEAESRSAISVIKFCMVVGGLALTMHIALWITAAMGI
jgi:hypothetical protein